MRAVLLAAGVGIRLRPITRWVPKPLLPLFDVPIIEHNLLQLKDHGVEEVFVNLHHLPFGIVRHLKDGAHLGIRIHYSLEPEILGTAGALKKLQRHLEEETFLVVNSDTYRSWDLKSLLEAHISGGAAVTLLLQPAGDYQQSSTVVVNSRGRVVKFPGAFDSGGRNLLKAHFLGVYLMDPRTLNFIPQGRPWHLQQLITSLNLNGLLVQGHLQHGYWMDLGTVERYIRIHAHVLHGRCTMKTLKATQQDGIWQARGARVSMNASLHPPLYMGEGSQISPGASVGPLAVVGRGCRIGPNATVRRALLWEGQRVPPGAEVEDVLLTPWCSLKLPADYWSVDER